MTDTQTKLINKRISFERRIVDRFIDDALGAGRLIKVHNGEEFVTGRLRDASAIRAAMFTSGENTLFLYTVSGRFNEPAGWVNFVYGGDGYDVIADSARVDAEILAGAKSLARSIEDAETSGVYQY